MVLKVTGSAVIRFSMALDRPSYGPQKARSLGLGSTITLNLLSYGSQSLIAAVIYGLITMVSCRIEFTGHNDLEQAVIGGLIDMEKLFERRN